MGKIVCPTCLTFFTKKAHLIYCMYYYYGVSVLFQYLKRKKENMFGREKKAEVSKAQIFVSICLLPEKCGWYFCKRQGRFLKGWHMYQHIMLLHSGITVLFAGTENFSERERENVGEIQVIQLFSEFFYLPQQ